VAWRCPACAVRPQADGEAERHIGILKKAIAKLLADEGGSWADQIPRALLAMRSRSKKPGMISPFELRFGRPMKTPLAFERPEQELQTMEVKEMRRIKERVEAAIEEAAAKAKERFDKGRTEAELKEGDLVKLRQHKPANALAPKNVGPYEVEEVLSPLNVKVKEVVGGPKLGQRRPVVNVKHVAEFGPKEVPGAREFLVEDVLGHSGKGKRKKFHVLWADGSQSWEPRASLVDIEEDGAEVLNDALLNYLRRNPRLR